MQVNISLINELEEALRSGSSEKRVNTLRRVTGLFLNESELLSEQQISVFDDVLVHQVQRIETRALVELSTNLAPIEKAPIEVIRQLARHDEITVAGPVLTQSSRLADSDLIEIAKGKSQEHLLAISGRPVLAEAVTDILIEHGNSDVSHKLAENAGARFSEQGFSKIVDSSRHDNDLAEKLGPRLDFPTSLLRQLLSRANDLVRSRLLASVPPEKAKIILGEIENIVKEVGWDAAGPRNFKASDNLVFELNRNGKLTEQVLAGFVNEHRYEEMTSTLALFCAAPVQFIERLMRNVSPDGLIIACKSARLHWPTVSGILKARFAHHAITDAEFEEAKKAFLALTQLTAQRTFRFMLVQDKGKTA
jgi:uncharacterized protein (DUF2336 family)